MKIHIVQKGDTLWELANQYEVDFEQLKQLNPQLSSPDMIMPSMKIKIPSTSKPVKNNYASDKEMQKPMANHPYKDTSMKPMPTINEDDYKKPAKVEPKMPVQPEMPVQPMTPVQPKMQQPSMQQPSVEQEMNYYDTTINLPHHHPQKEKSKEMQQMPQQVVMICPHCFKPSCPPPPMQHGNPHQMGKNDCGCGGNQPMHHENPYQMGEKNYGYGGTGPKHMYDAPTNNNMMGSYQQSPHMQMPEPPPMQAPYNNNNSPYDPSVPPQGMGMQPGFHSQNVPPQSHPHFSNDANQNMPYPTPPQFPGNQMFTSREEEEDDSKGE